MPGRRPGPRPRRGPRQRLRRWPGLRKPRGAGEYAAAGLVALAAAAVLTDVAIAVWGTMLDHWPVVAALAAGACAYGAWRLSRSLRARRERAARLATLRLTLAQIDAADDRQFEHALRTCSSGTAGRRGRSAGRATRPPTSSAGTGSAAGSSCRPSTPESAARWVCR